MSNNFLPKIVR